MYTAVFTERSEFFRAARKPEWLAGDPKKPVDLKEEDPDVFNEYMNCVYFGPNALHHYTRDAEQGHHVHDLEHVTYRALVRVYLLADKLQDPTTANIAIDEIIRSSDASRTVPGTEYAHVYSRTPRNSPLQRLMRDFWIYELDPEAEKPLDGVPREMKEDIMLEFLRVKVKHEGAAVREAFKKTLSAETKRDKCRYHQHDEKHPRCDPESISG